MRGTSRRTVFFYRRHDRQHEFWLSSWSAFICRAIASSSLLIIDNRCTAECKFWIFLSYRELCTNRSSKRFNNAAVGQHMKSHTNKWLKVAIGSGVTQRSLWNLFFFFLDEDGEHGPHLSTRDLFHEPRNPGALYWFASIRFLVCWYRHCVWTGLNWYKSPSLFLCGSNTTQGPMKFDIYFYFLRIDSATRKVGGNAIWLYNRVL